MHHHPYRVALAFMVLAALAPTAGAQDSNQLLKQSLKDTDVHATWIYNDVSAGLAEAKKTGKPLLVVFR